MPSLSSATHEAHPAGFVPLQQAHPEPADLATSDAGEIDRLLHNGFPWLSFPPSLESRFQADTAADRLHTLIASGALVSVLFNWLLLSDWMMIPDMFDEALRLRLLFYTPMMLLGLLVLPRLVTPAQREGSLVVSGVIAALLNVYLCVRSTDANAGPYLVSLTVIVVYCNTVARMRVRPAVVLDALIAALFFAGWAAIPQAPVAIMAPAALTLVSSVVFTLYGAYTQERDVRQNWLLLMRERLLQHELRQANASLEEASRSDLLTELASRRHFDESLERLWETARAQGQEISLILVDVDHFKAYNLAHGHHQGDVCLREIAAVLKSKLRRPEDLVARFAGEEFIAVMVGTPLQTAVGAAERIRKAVEALQLRHGPAEPDRVTVSVGVSCMRPNSPHASAAQLIAVADEALHLAKKRGRNCVIAFGTQD
ncbi:MAG: GGDEF domain-containing protein [Burkholderiales bacterium]|nr:GGDEF domain-containing protein [Burkholderiales bacterium]